MQPTDTVILKNNRTGKERKVLRMYADRKLSNYPLTFTIIEICQKNQTENQQLQSNQTA